MTATTDVLAVNDLSVTIGARTIVQNASLSVQRGSVIAITGHNGSGKTVLCDAICGFVQATGSVHLNGIDASLWPAWRRAREFVARVFQQIRSLDRVTVRDTISFAASGRRTDAIAAVRPLLSARWSELSDGQRRLVASCVAFARAKPIVILDEPFAGLAVDACTAVLTLIREHCRRGGTIVIVEHRLSALTAIADEVRTMISGRLNSGERVNA